MAGQRLDYGIERQRHTGFVGRDAVLAALDRLLLDDPTDRWIVVTGGPGMGKSAILAAWLVRREAAGAVVPHHFIRRGFYGWDEPATIVRSLAAQVEACYPAQRDPDARPESRLVDLLSRVSARELVPRGEHLVLLVDGLDEYDPPKDAWSDPLATFLPHALPPGVRLLCASRPRHPYLDALATRGRLQRLDLDDRSRADDNDATVRTFWRREATVLGLGDPFIQEAVERARGNLQHAVMMRNHLENTAPAQRRVETIPSGLKSLLILLWQRVANDAIARRGLGILCAAREPLSLDELGAVAGWDGVAPREEFVHAARELLLETWRDNGLAEYRLHHDSIREHIALQLGSAVIRSHHADLAQKLATWPAAADPDARQYALRHALVHRTEAHDTEAVGQLACDLIFLEAKCRELGVHDVEADVARAATQCRTHGDEATASDLGDLAHALARESHWIRDEPSVLAAQLWNRLRRMEWSAEKLDWRLRLPTSRVEFMRVRHVVSRESPALLRDLSGHSGEVTSCAVTPDGRRIVSASHDKTLKVWDLNTGRALATLEGHSGVVNSCAITPDGRRVVSASHDRTLKIWDLDTGCLVTTLKGHTGSVSSCAVTPDGQHVISASYDKTLRVWELDTGHLVTTLKGHTEAVTSCAITPNGRRVISASYNSENKDLKIWDLDTGRVLSTLEGHTGTVNSCAVTPDGQRVVSTSDDETLRVWDLDTGRVLMTLEGHLDDVISCVVTPDGRRVVSGSSDRTLKVWDLDTGHALATLEGHIEWVSSCAVTGDGKRLISASGDHTLKVWQLDAGRVSTILEGHTAGLSSFAVTPDGRRVVSASGDKTLKVWDLDSGRALMTLEGHAEAVISCAVTPDGRRVVSASSDKTLKVWDLDTGRVLAILDAHSGRVMSCAVTPDGRRVVSALDDRRLLVWDLETGRVLMTLLGHTGSVNSCAVTPDGRYVVSASSDKTLKVWDLNTGRALMMLQDHTKAVYGCTVTADSQFVISTSFDDTLKIWDLGNSRVLATLQGHANSVRGCTVTPDGRFAISASIDKTLKVWDLTTHQCLATHRGDTSFTAVIATTTTICAGDDAGTIWFLDWPPSLMPLPLATEPAHESLRSMIPTKPLRKLTPRPPSHIILFLAANPIDTSQLALDQECAAIERELRMTANRDDFEFRSAWAVTVDELARHLMELEPTVIHFSGHGARSGSSAESSSATTRDLVLPNSSGSSGIYLHAEQGGSQLVTPRALAMMIKSTAPSARLLVLNACYSEPQADVLRTAVDCVVGMTGAITDDAARSFAVGFYRALGNRRSVGHAVDHALATLAAKQYPDEDLPRCRTRDGIEAHKLVLTAQTAGSR